jgi:hypothetical protein
MSMWFLLFLLAGVALLAYGGVMFAFGRRRNAGLVFGAAAVLMGISAPFGLLIGDGSSDTAGLPLTPSIANLSMVGPQVMAAASQVAFSYPAEAEKLDAQDFLLQGTGKPGETLELTQDGVLLGSVVVGADGTWSYNVSKPKAGAYAFEIKGASSSATRAVTVEQGLTTASNAQCPCRLRILPNEKQALTGTTAVLFKDGTEVARGAAPFVFSELSAGEYTFTLEGTGYVTSKPAKATLPKNKSLSVYLEKQK